MAKNKPDERPQSERFIQTARELGCDEDEASFDEKLRRIASAKPNRQKSPPTKSRTRKPDP